MTGLPEYLETLSGDYRRLRLLSAYLHSIGLERYTVGAYTFKAYPSSSSTDVLSGKFIFDTLEGLT